MHGKEYKGLYYKDVKTQKFFEGGAHFKYKDLYFLLQKLNQSSTKSSSTIKRTSVPKDNSNKLLSKNHIIKTRNGVSINNNAQNAQTQQINLISINVNSSLINKQFQTKMPNTINKKPIELKLDPEEKALKTDRIRTMSDLKDDNEHKDSDNLPNNKKYTYIKVNGVLTNRNQEQEEDKQTMLQRIRAKIKEKMKDYPEKCIINNHKTNGTDKPAYKSRNSDLKRYHSNVQTEFRNKGPDISLTNTKRRNDTIEQLNKTESIRKYIARERSLQKSHNEQIDKSNLKPLKKRNCDSRRKVCSSLSMAHNDIEKYKKENYNSLNTKNIGNTAEKKKVKKSLVKSFDNGGKS